ncbi:MAG: hypothetical protein AB7W37_18095 [Syntrophobacteraceae bacterium]
MVPFLEPEKKKRQACGQGGVLLVEILPQAKSKARDDAGALVGVSGRSVSDAKRVAFFIRHVAKNINR